VTQGTGRFSLAASTMSGVGCCVVAVWWRQQSHTKAQEYARCGWARAYVTNHLARQTCQPSGQSFTCWEGPRSAHKICFVLEQKPLHPEVITVIWPHVERATVGSGSDRGYGGPQLYHITYHQHAHERMFVGDHRRGCIQAHSIRSSELLSRTHLRCDSSLRCTAPVLLACT
jgi:hypothetical protein